MLHRICHVLVKTKHLYQFYFLNWNFLKIVPNFLEMKNLDVCSIALGIFWISNPCYLSPTCVALLVVWRGVLSRWNTLYRLCIFFLFISWNAVPLKWSALYLCRISRWVATYSPSISRFNLLIAWIILNYSVEKVIENFRKVIFFYDLLT